MKLEAHAQVGSFASKHLPQPRPNAIVQRQRSAAVIDFDHVVLMERDHAATADRASELRHGLYRIGLIHQNAATHGCVEGAAFWKRRVEATFDESDVR